MYIARSNIFISDSPTARFFEQYSIQVSVLNRPEDISFTSAMQELALHLHILTGKHVVFFPLIDPPDDWKEAVRGTQYEDWWRREMRFGGSFDDTLVSRLASFFGLAWSELPALVISPSLWNGAYITTPTDANLIEAQLQVLTNLANQHDHPSIEVIEHELQNRLGSPIKKVNEDARFLASFYSFLETYNPKDNRFTERYWNLIGGELRQILPVLIEMRHQNIEDDNVDERNQGTIKLVFDQLLAPAHVASLGYKDKFPNLLDEFPILSMMEPESQITIKSAALVGSYIDFLNSLRAPVFHLNDYTPAAQGYWKAFENEMNFSLIQIERASLGIDLKKYYTLYQPDFPREKSLIDTPQRKNLNQHVEGVLKHKFLPLGDNWHVFNTLLNSTQYQNLGFEDLLLNNFGFDLTSQFTDVWKTIRDIRNKGSHVASLQKGQFEELFNTIRDVHAFPPLVRLKQKILDNIRA